MDITGVIKVIMDEQRFESGFFKREFVITTEEQYPQDIIFEMHKERSEAVASRQQGERIRVYFDIRGREWNGRYFNNLVAWKVEAAGAEGAAPAGAQGVPSMENLPQIDPVDVADEEDDDLPF